jgi:hypothetical protein
MVSPAASGSCLGNIKESGGYDVEGGIAPRSMPGVATQNRAGCPKKMDNLP